MGESEQLAIFDRFAARAYELALDSMAANYHRVMALARMRFIDGYAEYGDAMFTAGAEKLYRDMLEEFADSVCYGVPMIWQAENRA